MPSTHRPSTFYALGVRPALAAALAERGITEPFPIQAASLPDSLAGRDVLGRGRTGSGKTVAFALPALERVLEAGRRAPRRPRALVLVPTRELAVQVQETLEHLAHAVRLKSMTVFGGVRYDGQIRKLERGVDVVVATPGRLEDLLERGALVLDDVVAVVLDEADLMADMGFLPPVTRILQACPPGQRLLFSATLDEDVARLVDAFLRDPLVHAVEDADSGPEAVHHLLLVRLDNKHAVVRELLSGGGRALAFTRTKAGAERLARDLTAAGVPAVDLHGNLRQAQRQRHLSAFADGSVAVLVATDIAARGIHVDDVGLVLHVDPPHDPKAFLHRSGRTARAGAEGTVVTLATRNQNKEVRALLAHAKIKPQQAVVAPGDSLLAALRPGRVERAASGPSIFEPDPEDAVEDAPAREPRPRPERGARRAGGWDADRPRREPKAREAGPRGPRPDAGEARARREPGRRRDQPRGERWSWDPEPWEAAAPRRGRPERRGEPERRSEQGRSEQGGREQAAPARTRAWGRGEGRVAEPRSAAPRPEREASEGRAGAKKGRWGAEDHRRAQESQQRGFGYRKSGAAPARGRARAQDKDKGKPKRWR